MKRKRWIAIISILGLIILVQLAGMLLARLGMPVYYIQSDGNGIRLVRSTPESQSPLPTLEPGTAPALREDAIPVIIDTDMAGDDWMAILYLLQHPDVNVIAITVTGTGEAHRAPGIRHALDLAMLAGRPKVPVEVIFHDADYDLRILDRDYGFRARHVWDTRVAAQLAGEAACGLGTLLEKYFGIRLSKELQRADWSERPLTPAMIAYAAAETAYLPALRDRLAKQLTTLGRAHWAAEEFQHLEDVRWTPRAAAGEEYLGLKGANTLHPAQLAVLRALWEWRDGEARRLDRAPFRVIGNEFLLVLARAAPADEAALAAMPAFPRALARRHGSALLAAVVAGRAVPPDAWPRVDRRPRERPDPVVEERMARLKALRSTRAPAVSLDPGSHTQMVLTFLNFRPAVCIRRQIVRAVPGCGSARESRA